jgi:hypothetical protein
MKFRSSLATEENVSEDIFNAVSIYVPKSLASANLADDAFDPADITATKYGVIAVNVDNYNKVFKEGGALLSQWLPVFNDGTNSAVTLYIIIFDDTTFAPTVTANGIVWNPLSKAFKELYFISFFKTMFSEHYDGAKVEHDPAEEGDYDDSNYFDMALCLAQLCEAESTLSFCLTEAHVVVPEEGEADVNACKVMTQTRGDETTYCTTLAGSTVATRAQYFWGFLNLIAPKHTELHIHNGSFMIPIILGSWFEQTNASGEYVGNKLAKIRLSGSKVKPTGLPSPLDSDVNQNLPADIYANLDAKFVGYFISISSASRNNAEFIRDRSIENFPITAYAISKWIDYTASQALANYATARNTLTNPVLANEETYTYIQQLVQGVINTFASAGRIVDVTLSFPPYSEAKKGQTFEGTAVWTARYIDDLEGVELSGSITF